MCLSARWRLDGLSRSFSASLPRGVFETTCKTRRATGGEGLRCCWPGGAGLGPAREKILAKPNEHESNSPRKARRPARGERLRFLEPDRRRTGPTGADRECEPAIRNVPQPPEFRRHSYLSGGSERSGEFRGYTPRSSSWLSLCQRVQAPASRRAKNNLLWPFYALLTARFDKHLQLERLRALL